jgi:hypothetical protein
VGHYLLTAFSSSFLLFCAEKKLKFQEYFLKNHRFNEKRKKFQFHLMDCFFFVVSSGVGWMVAGLFLTSFKVEEY